MSDLPEHFISDLRAAGLTVVVVEDWQRRGRPGPFEPVGVLNHHTGVSAKGWSLAKELAYAKWLFLQGRADLPAPLCQMSLGRSGTVYLGAAGRANHGGVARASGSVAAGDANTLYAGIEWMLSGTEDIPAEMMEAGVTLNAVLCEKVTHNSVNTISCHYNTSVTGKWDIGDPNGILVNGSKVLDVAKFRRSVEAERVRLYDARPIRKRLRAGLINIPIKVGPAAWAECWYETAKRSSIFGVCESFTAEQRNVYSDCMRKFSREFRSFGLRNTPNPVFWARERFTLVTGKIHQIHPANTSARNANKYPGFYAARYITEVVLCQDSDNTEVAVIHTHFAADVNVVDQKWLDDVREKSKDAVRDLVRKHDKAGRVVIVMGDTNIHGLFPMPRGFHWHEGHTIDKIGSNRQGSAGIFDAPTDHKHGVRATIRL